MIAPFRRVGDALFFLNAGLTERQIRVAQDCPFEIAGF